MKFGYCTGFSTNPHFKLGTELLSMIKRSGFDYVEFPLMNFYQMGESDFSDVENTVKSMSLCGPVACNFFPGNIRLVGKDVNEDRISAYLNDVLPKCASLGIKKIILGSGPARTFGPDQTEVQAYEQFLTLIKEVILPMTKKFGITVCIEPFEKTYCNLIVSVPQGKRLVEDVGDSSFMLMVDLYHMLCNGESIEELKTCFDLIKHVHVAGPDRFVPRDTDSYIWDALELLSSLGYNDSLSFETELAESELYLMNTLTKVKNYFRR